MPAQAYFSYSLLCLEFAASVGFETDPEAAICHLSDKLRKRSQKSDADSIDRLSKLRNVVDVTYLRGNEFDGKLEPLGGDYGAGFGMFLNQNLSAARLRFTALHELMHTFFYENVPDRKFRDHVTDAGEERLCNLGAAQFLMPKAELRKATKAKPICLETAESLCAQFMVSLPALILRLRQLKIWNVQLSTWVQLSNGKPVVEGSIGGFGNDWSWMESDKVNAAFRGDYGGSSDAYLIRFTSDGDRQVRRIRYDFARRGRYLHVLSGSQVSRSVRQEPSLFASSSVNAGRLPHAVLR